VVNNTQVRNGLGGEQDATLQVGSMSQTVMVTASAPTVETTNATLVGTVGNLGSGRGLGSGPEAALVAASVAFQAKGQSIGP